MHQRNLFIATAILEGAIGLLLLLAPAGPIFILLGVEAASADAIAISRVAGAALLALGAACWFARKDEGSRAQTGVLIGILIYDGAVALALANIGVSHMAGVLLWPAVVLHTALAVWCLLSFRTN